LGYSPLLVSPRSRALLPAVALAAALVLPASAATPPEDVSPAEALRYRRWIQAMKEAPRGPFARIRWFCADGTVHPPRPYPCAERGGGIQHGQWSERTRTLREHGFTVGTVLAEVDPREFTGPDARLDVLAEILLERFLRAFDDGWIFRGARNYRGALQAEDEEQGARELVEALLSDPAWREPSRFFLLREAVRLLPLPSDAVSAAEVRTLAVEVAEADPGFEDLRAKIHGFPDAGDAERVREYARQRGKTGLAEEYAHLAERIDALYAEQSGAEALAKLAATSDDPELAGPIRELAARLAKAEGPERRMAEASYLLAVTRDRLAQTEPGPEAALLLLQASLALEQDAYAAGNDLTRRLDAAPRLRQLGWLREVAQGLYGAGLLSGRQLVSARQAVERLTRRSRPELGPYRDELRYLSRIPEWSAATLSFHFGPAVEELAVLEPKAHLYPQDRMRGSPLLLAGAVVDRLVLDANRLAGIEHELFGASVGAGLRALNPGLARGALFAPEGAPERADPDGIYLLPETLADLPPVGGILTRGEGSSLSHVQLLARNLGIPNVVVGDALVPRVRERVGQRAVLAVSPGGVVQLAADGPRWDPVFGEERRGSEDVVIEPDLEKLDLETTRFVRLSELRAEDSGRISGPKGANLGELEHHYGELVPDGFVIPFGVFRQLLERPIEPGGPSAFVWMKSRYAAIAELSGDARERAVSDFLTRLRRWIVSADPGPAFRESLRETLRSTFGPDGSYGVFVRSDTNVEDLPGFTGAGLNLTVPNVVGTENILDAIRRVWASPFTERAYSWRQAHMEEPEYVFPAVLVQYSFPAEKSGVMVTTDVETGSREWLSIAASEGVGGAVEGQAAEGLLVRADGEEVRLLAQASAPERSVLASGGGVRRERASGSSRVLTPEEIQKLVDLARTAPKRFPALRADGGPPRPADIEFAFRDGQLALLQLRPFVESRRAQQSRYLRQLDQQVRSREGRRVSLASPPEGRSP